MPTLRVYLFGKFCVRRDEQVLDGFDARKVQELFCYLLLHRDHSLPRETLAGLLWPDTTTVQSKKGLRQVLWQLQSALGSQHEVARDRALLVEPDWVQLNSEANLWLDVAIFEQAFTLVQKMSGHELDASKAQVLQNAVQLYQGPLLEGWYHDWCLYERERLQSMYLAMLDKLMGYCEVHQDYETGLLYGMRIMCYDRARERTHRWLMRLHYLNGDRSAALRQYEQCVAVLAEELGAKPSKHTIALYEQIQADQLDKGSKPSTVGLIHAALHRALEDAVKQGLVARNVAKLVAPPRIERYDAHTLTVEQAEKLLEAARGSRLDVLLIVALTTGMRRGELLALRWDDIDFKQGLVSVHRTMTRVGGYGYVEGEPKTRSSRRRIVLPGVALEALRVHRIQQEQLRVNAGENWQDKGLVFCNGYGGFCSPDMVLRRFDKLLDEAGLPHRRFHDLRHSAATILLVAGVHPKVVQEHLGHSTIAMTLDVYSHVVPSMQQEAAGKIDDLFKHS